MSLSPVVLPPAREDVDEAYRWYENQRLGLGEEFLAELEASYQRIAATPKMHGVLYRGIRRAPLRRFPYGVYYRLRRRRLEIVAVIHVRRDTNVWKRRA